MNAAFNYENVITRSDYDLNKNLRSNKFYIANSILFKFVKFTKGIFLARKRVNRWIRSTEDLSQALSKGIAIFTRDFEEVKGTDLSDYIKKSQDRISEVSKTLNYFEVNPELSQLKFASFRKLISIHEKVLAQEYELLRIFKRANKKTPAPPSELAQQTAAYSMNNLSQVINAPR